MKNGKSIKSIDIGRRCIGLSLHGISTSFVRCRGVMKSSNIDRLHRLIDTVSFIAPPRDWGIKPALYMSASPSNFSDKSIAMIVNAMISTVSKWRFSCRAAHESRQNRSILIYRSTTYPTKICLMKTMNALFCDPAPGTYRKNRRFCSCILPAHR